MVDIERIDRVRALSALSTEAKSDLAAVAREVAYPADHRIVPLLKPLQEIIIILEGLAKMSGVAMSGVERIVYVYRPGEIIGSRVLLEKSPEASYQISAMGPVRGMAISKQDLLAVGRRHPDLLIAITAEFSRRLDQMTRRVLAAMSVEVPIRLSQVLLDFAGSDTVDGDEFVPLAHSLTHETMAQIIGASRPHTSTVLRDLEQVGAVKRRSRRGLLVQPQRLHEIIESETLGVAD